MKQTILKVENLSKKFCRNLKRSLWYGIRDITSEIFLDKNERSILRKDEFWALKNISFELNKGETLGLIGHNGAGKSTLLKLINGLIKPDEGYIRISGCVNALIELGAGFSPILTGRENIYVNAAVLGLPRKEVNRRLDEIIDFAEIGDFIDAPVQSYSSGMKVRLGFSIAANLNPDILLIDEILSVGDSSFRERCYDWINDYKAQGGTIIFVSHNSGVVEAISDRVIWLHHGKIVALGEPADAIDKYEREAHKISREAASRISDNQITRVGEDVLIESVKCCDASGHLKDVFEFDEPFQIRIQFQAPTEIVNPRFMIGFTKGWISSIPFSTIGMMADNTKMGSVVGKGCVCCLIKNPRMTPGEYNIIVGVKKHVSGQFGKKYYAEPQTLGRLQIKKDRFLQLYPSAQVSKFLTCAPIALKYEWDYDQVSLRSR